MAVDVPTRTPSGAQPPCGSFILLNFTEKVTDTIIIKLGKLKLFVEIHCGRKFCHSENLYQFWYIMAEKSASKLGSNEVQFDKITVIFLFYLISRMFTM